MIEITEFRSKFAPRWHVYNHDWRVALLFCRRRVSRAPTGSELKNTFRISVGGSPPLCLGDEIGQLNNYDYETDSEKLGDTRWICGPTFIVTGETIVATQQLAMEPY